MQFLYGSKTYMGVMALMFQVIAGVLGVIVVVLQALWKNRQRAKELENDPVEDVRQTHFRRSGFRA